MRFMIVVKATRDTEADKMPEEHNRIHCQLFLA